MQLLVLQVGIIRRNGEQSVFCFREENLILDDSSRIRPVNDTMGDSGNIDMMEILFILIINQY